MRFNFFLKKTISSRAKSKKNISGTLFCRSQFYQKKDSIVLTIKCAGCKRKLWKYEKIGSGEVIKCYKKRIPKIYDAKFEGKVVVCPCGKIIGTDKGSFIKMNQHAFVYTGTKQR